jgi:hypothetical protein
MALCEDRTRRGGPSAATDSAECSASPRGLRPQRHTKAEHLHQGRNAKVVKKITVVTHLSGVFQTQTGHTKGLAPGAASVMVAGVTG